MAKSDNHIIKCAIAVISRYGFKKTTMADLADAAGVSRQTLYNKYPNKEEVLRAAIRFGAAASLEQARIGWAATEGISAKLDVFFEVGPLSWYDAIVASPDSADLIEGVNANAAQEMAEATEAWLAAMSSIFEPFSDLLVRKGTNVADFTDFVYTASSSAKYNASSRDQLVKRLQILKISTLATLEA